MQAKEVPFWVLLYKVLICSKSRQNQLTTEVLFIFQTLFFSKRMPKFYFDGNFSPISLTKMQIRPSPFLG